MERAREVVDPWGGIVKRYFELDLPADEPPLHHYACTSARTQAFYPSSVPRSSGAAALHRPNAMIRALGEAIERYSSGMYDPHSLLYESWNGLDAADQDRALDPRRFALPSKRETERPWASVVPYSPDTTQGWVEGRHVATNDEVLVPGPFVYLPYHYRHDGALYFQSISTGLAAGSHPEEAYHTALSEVVERDAFLIMWHHEIPVPRIDPATIDDPEIQKLIDMAEAAGVEVYIFDIRNDIRVPSFLVVLRDHRPDAPAVTVAPSTHASPTSALRSALEEVFHTRLWTRHLLEFRSTDYEPPWDGVSDSNDHLLLWSRHDMVPHIEWLLDQEPEASFQDVDGYEGDDAKAAFEWVHERVQDVGLEAYAVDVTSPDVREAGFHVVRAVVPECQPLYLGTGALYLDNDRLYDLPVKLGHRDTRPTEADINTVPHPFP